MVNAMQKNKKELAYVVGKRTDNHFCIRETDYGYEYYLYDQFYREVDSGMCEKKRVTIEQARNKTLQKLARSGYDVGGKRKFESSKEVLSEAQLANTLLWDIP